MRKTPGFEEASAAEVEAGRNEGPHRFARTISRRVALLTSLACIAPYLYLVMYLRLDLHGEKDMAVMPGNPVFAFLAAIGVALPCLGAMEMVRRLIRERDRFRLGRVLEAYVCLVLIFASGYALLQTSSAEPSIVGMAQVWTPQPSTLDQHVERLHSIYLDSLYLSTITITTVGYGDMAPATGAAKLLTALEGLVGISFIGLVLGHYFSCVSSRGVDER